MRRSPGPRQPRTRNGSILPLRGDSAPGGDDDDDWSNACAHETDQRGLAAATSTSFAATRYSTRTPTGSWWSTGTASELGCTEIENRRAGEGPGPTVQAFIPPSTVR